MSSEENKNLKSRAKPLSADEIRKITRQAQEGFPAWALRDYGKTHSLRWVSQDKLFNEDDQVDKRGFEILKDPKTGKIARWNELLLGAMPKEIAEERKEEVRQKTLAQADYVKDKIEGMRDRLQYEMQQKGYRTHDTKFNYETNK